MNEALLIELNASIRALVPLVAELLKLQRAADKKWLSIKEAAEYLGFSVPTMYGKVHFREISSHGKGKRRRFSKEELDLYVKRQGKTKRLEIEP